MEKNLNIIDTILDKLFNQIHIDTHLLAPHWIRPYYLWLLIPCLLLAIFFIQKKTQTRTSWQKTCDPHLLPYILKKHEQTSSQTYQYFILSSIFFVIIALSGPSWKKLPQHTFQSLDPHVLILDMSNEMLATDLSPNRLTRAKFKILDILNSAKQGQWSLIAYTAEPFIVSPLTSDTQTINALVSSLNTDIMPVNGNQPALALLEAEKMLVTAGLNSGEILLLTATPPNQELINIAQKLAQHNISTSVIPITTQPHTEFKKLANAGKGQFIQATNDHSDILSWIESRNTQNTQQQKPLQHTDWEDNGRCFILLAILCLLPLFRRGVSECLDA